MGHNLARAGPVGASAPRIVTMVRQGQTGRLLASLPPASRGPMAAAIRSAFAAGLNDLLFVTGVLALAGAACALLLIRSQDFVRADHSRAMPPASGSGDAERVTQVRSA
jgi:hypothetical protein